MIGSLAGVVLIGVAVYFLACNKKDDKGNYEVAKVSFELDTVTQKVKNDFDSNLETNLKILF